MRSGANQSRDALMVFLYVAVLEKYFTTSSAFARGSSFGSRMRGGAPETSDTGHAVKLTRIRGDPSESHSGLAQNVHGL